MANERTNTPALLIALVCFCPFLADADGLSEPTNLGATLYREALFYSYQEDHFSALVRLLAAKKRAHLDTQHFEAELLLGRSYQSWRQPEKSAEVLQRVLAADAGSPINDQALLLSARLWHQRGFPAESQYALDKISGELPEQMETERRLLLTQLHTENGAYNKAIAVLRDWPAVDPLRQYAEFNLGAAMVRSGNTAGGAEILEVLGHLEPVNEEIASLRDKSNLALGYAYLQNGRSRAANEPLRRVRLEGPFSNQALLGAGWANVEVGEFRHALVPWTELRDRDPFDPAVQEVMLALPYAMVRLNALNQAAEQYSSAVEVFDAMSRHIDTALEGVRSGQVIAALLKAGGHGEFQQGADSEPALNETEWRSLYPVLATAEFQHRLASIRELMVMQERLDAWQRSTGAFRETLAERALRFERNWSIMKDRLSQSEFDSLVSRKLMFNARLDEIERTNDILALATESEFASWGKIIAVQSNPSVGALIPEAETARGKTNMLKGVLQWTFEEEFDARLLRARREMVVVGETLASTLRLRRLMVQSLRTERETIAHLKSQLDVADPQIDALRARIESAMARQRGLSEVLLADELQAGKIRLTSYTAQARFALAAIYDMAASQDASGDLTR